VFWVVTKLPKLGFGMPQSANCTGIEPEIVIDAVVRVADTVNVTFLVRPCRVRSPVAEWILTVPMAGSGASLIGRVSEKVPAG
jgi:hypothetical protein